MLKSQFPYLSVCLWQTSILNEFMIHQTGRFYLLAETDRNSLESVFYFLKEKKYPVFLKPKEEIIDKYFPEEKVPIIIKPLVS